MRRRFSDFDNNPTKKRANDECKQNIEWHEPPENYILQIQFQGKIRGSKESEQEITF